LVRVLHGEQVVFANHITRNQLVKGFLTYLVVAVWRPDVFKVQRVSEFPEAVERRMAFSVDKGPECRTFKTTCGIHADRPPSHVGKPPWWAMRKEEAAL